MGEIDAFGDKPYEPTQQAVNQPLYVIKHGADAFSKRIMICGAARFLHIGFINTIERWARE